MQKMSASAPTTTLSATVTLPPTARGTHTRKMNRANNRNNSLTPRSSRTRVNVPRGGLGAGRGRTRRGRGDGGDASAGALPPRSSTAVAATRATASSPSPGVEPFLRRSSDMCSPPCVARDASRASTRPMSSACKTARSRRDFFSKWRVAIGPRKKRTALGGENEREKVVRVPRPPPARSDREPSEIRGVLSNAPGLWTREASRCRKETASFEMDFAQRRYQILASFGGGRGAPAIRSVGRGVAALRASRLRLRHRLRVPSRRVVFL